MALAEAKVNQKGVDPIRVPYRLVGGGYAWLGFLEHVYIQDL